MNDEIRTNITTALGGFPMEVPWVNEERVREIAREEISAERARIAAEEAQREAQYRQQYLESTRYWEQRLAELGRTHD